MKPPPSLTCHLWSIFGGRLIPGICWTRKLGAIARLTLCRPVERDSKFSHVRHADIENFTRILGPKGILVKDADKAPYMRDWLNQYEGQGSVVLLPENSGQISEILRYCQDRSLALVPQGGNTGLVGGSVPVFDEIVLSTKRMTEIADLDPASGVLTCQAGAVVQEVEQWLEPHNRILPLDLGSKGTCCIGGTLATSAGGLRFFRFGSLHENVLGVEVVLADGTILDLMSSMRKNNTGYHLKHLFIGSEGTLGVITKAAILTQPRPKAINVALLCCSSFEDVQRTFHRARETLGEILSAVEFMDRPSLDLLFSQQRQRRDPFGSQFPFYLLIETYGSNNDHDNQKLNRFLEESINNGKVVDGVVAQDSRQARELFEIRENITVALSTAGHVYKYDISLPTSEFSNILERVKERVEPLGATVVGYGHFGDSNLHLNVSASSKDEHIAQAIEPFIYEEIAKLKGSISAEHGIGQQKLKASMDPKHILNPYKVIY